MVCLGRIEKKESYLSALPEQGISYLLNQNAAGTETSQLNSAMLHLEPAPVLRWLLPMFKGPGGAKTTN